MTISDYILVEKDAVIRFTIFTARHFPKWTGEEITITEKALLHYCLRAIDQRDDYAQALLHCTAAFIAWKTQAWPNDTDQATVSRDNLFRLWQAVTDTPKENPK